MVTIDDAKIVAADIANLIKPQLITVFGSVARENSGNDMNNHVQEWLSQAEEELRTATYLADGCFYRSACYHAEQALEKFLKAKLIDKGWDLEKTDSIKRLLVISEEYGLKYSFSEHDIAFIDSIYRGRYPMEAGLLPQGEPDADDAAHAITIVLSVLPAET